MNISSRCEYACRAVLELAHHANDPDPVTAVHIAERRHIPEKYLVHILLQLKRYGLVKSIRGALGGYMLTKSPSEITLLDLVQAIDGPVLNTLPLDENGSAELKPVWGEVAKDISSVLEQTTIQDIVDRSAKANMYYI